MSQVIHTALQYNLKVPRCLWATGKVVIIIAGYSFLWHKASYLCKWCWAVGLFLGLVLGAHWSSFSCVCQPVLQALTALKLALLSLLEQHNLSGEQQKVREGLGIHLYLAACWGRIRSGAGKMKTEPCFSPAICSRGHIHGCFRTLFPNEDESRTYHFIIRQDFLINDGGIWHI